MLNGLIGNGEIFGGYMESGLMGNGLIRNKPSQNIFESINPLSDPYINNVELYLKFNEFPVIDSSTNPKTITVLNNPSFSSTIKSPEPNSIGSINFTGIYNAPGLSVTSPNLILGTGDFTIEVWIRDIGSIYSNSDNYVYVSVLGFNISGRNGNWFVSPPGLGGYTGYTTNVWTQVSITRQAGTLRIFGNGSLVDTRAYTNNLTSNIVSFPLQKSNYDFTSAYYDYLRITKGVCRYTANYNHLDLTVTNRY